jgi:hypothetical protein
MIPEPYDSESEVFFNETYQIWYVFRNPEVWTKNLCWSNAAQRSRKSPRVNGLKAFLIGKAEIRPLAFLEIRPSQVFANRVMGTFS